MLDKACKEVRDAGMKAVTRTPKKAAAPALSSSPEIHQQFPDIRQRLFPAIYKI
jgi:hypothetical protein